MRHSIVIALAVLLLGGCAPKMGKDIFIEPEGNIRFENSESELVLGALSLLGISVNNGPIRLGSDLKVTNKWHSDLTLISLSYTLNDEKSSLGSGEAVINTLHPIVVASGDQKSIPLVLRIDPKRLSANQILGVMQSKRKLFLKGDAVVEVWGIQKHYPFEKEITKLVQKALK